MTQYTIIIIIIIIVNVLFLSNSIINVIIVFSENIVQSQGILGVIAKIIIEPLCRISIRIISLVALVKHMDCCKDLSTNRPSFNHTCVQLLCM